MYFGMTLPASAVEHTYLEQQGQVRKITLVNISYTSNSGEYYRDHTVELPGVEAK